MGAHIGVLQPAPGQVGKCRSQGRIAVMSLNLWPVSAVLSQRMAPRLALFGLLKPPSIRLRCR